MFQLRYIFFGALFVSSLGVASTTQASIVESESTETAAAADNSAESMAEYPSPEVIEQCLDKCESKCISTGHRGGYCSYTLNCHCF